MKTALTNCEKEKKVARPHLVRYLGEISLSRQPSGSGGKLLEKTYQSILQRTTVRWNKIYWFRFQRIQPENASNVQKPIFHFWIFETGLPDFVRLNDPENSTDKIGILQNSSHYFQVFILPAVTVIDKDHNPTSKSLKLKLEQQSFSSASTKW